MATACRLLEPLGFRVEAVDLVVSHEGRSEHEHLVRWPLRRGRASTGLCGAKQQPAAMLEGRHPPWDDPDDERLTCSGPASA